MGKRTRDCREALIRVRRMAWEHRMGAVASPRRWHRLLLTSLPLKRRTTTHGQDTAEKIPELRREAEAPPTPQKDWERSSIKLGHNFQEKCLKVKPLKTFRKPKLYKDIMIHIWSTCNIGIEIQLASRKIPKWIPNTLPHIFHTLFMGEQGEIEDALI